VAAIVEEEELKDDTKRSHKDPIAFNISGSDHHGHFKSFSTAVDGDRPTKTPTLFRSNLVTPEEEDKDDPAPASPKVCMVVELSNSSMQSPESSANKEGAWF